MVNGIIGVAPLLIRNAAVMRSTGLQDRGWLLADEGRIRAIGAGEAPDFGGAEIVDADGLMLLPGFVDLHFHGAMGHDAMDGQPEAIRGMARFAARHGVTAILPTTSTDSRERIHAALAAVAACVGSQLDGAAVLGAHLEGPFLNVAKCGAQSVEHIRRADPAEAHAYLEMNVLRLVSLAPEYPENHWLIDECVKRGITVSAAHTAATYEQMQAAFLRGVSHATHTFNAMVGLHHREPGTVGAVLTASQVTCELIADNIHVHPAVMQVLLAAKGDNGVVLVTDAIRGAGLPDGAYEVDARTVTIREGVVRLPDGTLAGSVLTMDRAVYNLMRATGRPLESVWKASSLNAARAIGVADRKGSLDVGKDADMVLVDRDVNVHLTVVEGRVVYRR